MEELREQSFWERKLSYAVSRRAQEIGVHKALGADRGDVLRLIVGQGLKLAVFGVVIGSILAPIVTQTVTSQLYNVTLTDPLSFAGIALFLTPTAFFASQTSRRVARWWWTLSRR